MNLNIPALNLEEPRTDELDVLPVGRAWLRAQDKDNLATRRGDSRGGDALGALLGDRVKHVLDGVAGGRLDLRHDLGVSVVEHRVGP